MRFPKRSTVWIAAGIILALVAVVMWLSPTMAQLVGGLAALAVGAWCFTKGILLSHRRRSVLPPSAPGGGNALPLQAAQDAADESERSDLSVLGARKVREEWADTERMVDEVLQWCVDIIRSRTDAHTVAVFFPTDDNGFRLRKYHSKSEFVNSGAVIYPGVGVIGSFLKQGMKSLYLEEIVTDSMTLYYYSRDAGIRSLMASPIVAAGGERGVMIVDSTEPKHFNDTDHAFLSAVARLCGSAVYHAYSNTEHRLRYARYAAITNVEKYFFEKKDVEAVLDKMTEIIPHAVPCDRFTISLRDSDADTATIRRAYGLGAEQLVGKRFTLGAKTLTGLLYAKNMSFFRNLSGEHYEVRYFDDEPRVRELVSFLALPVGMDECRGGLLLESASADAFSDAHRALLSRLVTSAGIAIEKMVILEQEKNLATHDGLTGLNNHRHFQKLLRDEITRANRYNDPLAFILSDIDFFKKINDTYGHPFGDTVLKGVSACLLENIRDGVDVAARYGGEEFALILVKSSTASALETSERIRQQIAGISFTGPHGEPVHVSMSFGIAVYGEHTRHTDALIQKADKALYRAKQNGRNRVEVC